MKKNIKEIGGGGPWSPPAPSMLHRW